MTRSSLAARVERLEQGAEPATPPCQVEVTEREAQYARRFPMPDLLPGRASCATSSSRSTHPTMRAGSTSCAGMAKPAAERAEDADPEEATAMPIVTVRGDEEPTPTVDPGQLINERVHKLLANKQALDREDTIRIALRELPEAAEAYAAGQDLPAGSVDKHGQPSARSASTAILAWNTCGWSRWRWPTRACIDAARAASPGAIRS